MCNNPKVSVIIPTYKRPDTLCRSIDSVINQTYKNIEIIVIDDNDPEDDFRLETEKAMDKYLNNDKIIYLKHEKNKNGAVARNTGIKKATGKYIALLDDDDEFLPKKIEEQILKMESLDDSWGLCYTNYCKKDGDRLLEKGWEKKEGNLKNQALMRNLYIYGGSNLLVRKKLIDQIGGFDENFNRNQDLEFLVRLLEISKIAYVDKNLLIINYDNRVTNPTILDAQNIENLFIESFEDHIDLLDNKEKKYLNCMLKLDMFKYIIIKKDFLRAIKYLKDNKIKLKILIKYIVYLIHRKVSKKCYGFDIISIKI